MTRPTLLISLVKSAMGGMSKRSRGTRRSLPVRTSGKSHVGGAADPTFRYDFGRSRVR